MSNNINKAAFPRPASEGSQARKEGYGEQTGLTKRECFTAIAMLGELLTADRGTTAITIAAHAREVADATLKELEENPCPD